MRRELVSIIRLMADALPSKIRNSKKFFSLTQKFFRIPNHLYYFREEYNKGKFKDLASLYIKGNPMELPELNDKGGINFFHVRLIRHYISHESPNSILDVGCGSGHLISFLDKLTKKSKIVGIDIETPELNKFIYFKNNEITFLKGKVDNLLKSFEENSFEFVICTHFLEHIENPHYVIRELRRICSKTLILICPLEKPFKWGFNYHVNFYRNTDAFVKTALKSKNLNSEFKTHERIGDTMYVEFIEKR